MTDDFIKNINNLLRPGLAAFFCFAVIMSAIISTADTVRVNNFAYDPHGKRDPLVPLIGVDKSAPGVVPLAEAISIDDLKLQGIVAQTSGARKAVMNGEVVVEGFRAGELEIIKITKDSVSLTIGGREYTMKLFEEGGKK